MLSHCCSYIIISTVLRTGLIGGCILLLIVAAHYYIVLVGPGRPARMKNPRAQPGRPLDSVRSGAGGSIKNEVVGCGDQKS